MKLFKNIFWILLFLTLLSGCTNNNTPEETQTIYEKDFLSNYDGISSKYKWSEWFNTCLASNISYCYQRTVTAEALDTQNVLACDDIQDESLRQECINSIVSFKAREESNIESCAAITGIEQVDCKYSIASEKAILEWNIEACDLIQAHDDVSEEISDFYINAQKDCKYNTYSNLAIVENDSIICNKIWERDAKQNCIEQVKSLEQARESFNSSATEIESETKIETEVIAQ